MSKVMLPHTAATPVVKLMDINKNPLYIFQDLTGLFTEQQLREGVNPSEDYYHLSEFSYEFNEKSLEDDTCTIKIVTNSIALLDSVNLPIKSKIWVQWGFILPSADDNGNSILLRNPIQVMIRDVNRSYTPTEISITITGTDNFSFFLQEKTNEISTSDEFAAFVDAANSVIDVHVVAAKSSMVQVYSLYTPKTLTDAAEDMMKDSDAKGNYVRRVLKKHYLPEEIWGTESIFTGKDGKNLRVEDSPTGALGANKIINGSGVLKEEWITREQYDTEMAEYAGMATPEQEANDAKLFPEKEKNLKSKQFNANYAEGIKNAVSKNKGGPWKVTGRGNGMIISNMNFKQPAYREYNFGGEVKDNIIGTGSMIYSDGDLLDFTFDSSNKYKSKSMKGVLKIDPKTGQVVLSDYKQVEKVKPDDTFTPDQARDKYAEIDYNKSILSSFQKGEMPKPKHYYTIGLPDQSYQLSKDGTWHPGRDETALIQLRHLEFKPMAEELQEEIDNQVINGNGDDSEERNKINMTILGDPYITSGVVVEVAGLSKKDNGKYYLTKVCHTLSEGSGYTVKMEGFDRTKYPTTMKTTQFITVTQKKIKALNNPNIADALKFTKEMTLGDFSDKTYQNYKVVTVVNGKSTEKIYYRQTRQDIRLVLERAFPHGYANVDAIHIYQEDENKKWVNTMPHVYMEGEKGAFKTPAELETMEKTTPPAASDPNYKEDDNTPNPPTQKGFYERVIENTINFLVGPEDTSDL